MNLPFDFLAPGDPGGQQRAPSQIGSKMPIDPTPPDAMVSLDPLPPSEDLLFYTEQMVHKAKSQDLTITSSNPKPKDKILSWLHADLAKIIAFPILEGLDDIAKVQWQ